MITLEPLTHGEAKTWIEQSLIDFAEDLAKTRNLGSGEALVEAKSMLQEILPQGELTRGTTSDGSLTPGIGWRESGSAQLSGTRRPSTSGTRWWTTTSRGTRPFRVTPLTRLGRAAAW